MEFKHKSVLLKETIDNLNVKPDGIYVDGTLGGAGHASEVCKLLSATGRLIGIDQDDAAIQAASERLRDYQDRTMIIRSNYCHTYLPADESFAYKKDFLFVEKGIREITRQKELYRDYPFRQKMDELQNAARSLAQTLLNRDGVRKNYHRVSPPVVVSKKGEAQTAEKPQDKPGLSCGNEKKKVKTKTASVKKQAKPKL